MQIMSTLKQVRNYALPLIITSLMSACGGGGGGGGGSSESASDGGMMAIRNISGSVGDGPIAGAQVTAYDADGVFLGTVTSDSQARYILSIPDVAKYPVTITTTGGVDLVTGTAPTFSMVTVALDKEDITANINPFSTLIVKAAKTMPDGITAENLNRANKIVTEALNFGLDRTQVSNPIDETISESNVVTIIKSSELLAEMIKRTHSAALRTNPGLTQDGVINALADDMVDGVMDGVGVSAARPDISAKSALISGQILMEDMSNTFMIKGKPATTLMDSAMRKTMPSATGTTANTDITAEMIAQAHAASSIAKTLNQSTDMTDFDTLLANLKPGTNNRSSSSATTEMINAFNTAISTSDITTGSKAQLFATRARSIKRNMMPAVQIEANRTSVNKNDYIEIQWAASNSAYCVATEGWTGNKKVAGKEIIGPVSASADYVLSCYNQAGLSASKTITINVAGSGVVNLSGSASDTSSVKKLGVHNVTASGYDTSRARMPTNVIDGEMDSVWSVRNMPQWIILDLGKEALVNRSRIMMVTGNSFAPVTYTISASNDKSYWVNLAAGEHFALSQGWDEQTFGSILARYVKVELDSTDPANYANVIEIEVYGTESPSTVSLGDMIGQTISLAWQQNPDVIQGYKVYYGASADTVTNEVADIPVASAGFMPVAPSKNLDTWKDLRLPSGSTACFAIRAYNSDGLSPATLPVCNVI